MLRNPNKILFILVVLAFVLRLGGISHGLPFVFHPDEPTIVNSALAVRFNPNPGHFDWPHFYIYLNYFLYMAFAFLRNFIDDVHFKEIFIKYLPVLWNDEVVFVLLTRILTAIFGALTLIPIYLAGKSMFSNKIGLLSAFGFATFQLLVRNSHYTMPDTAMTFFLAWGLYYCTRILMERDFTNYALAGFFFGLSASTKYNGALAIILIPLAHMLSPLFFKFSENYERKKYGFFNAVSLFIATVMSSALGFVIGTPYAVLDYKNFIRTDGPVGALWQFTNVGRSVIFDKTNLVIDRIVWKVGSEVSYVALVAVFAVLFMILVRLFIKKFNRFDVCLLLLLMPTIVLLVYIAGNERSRSHYFMILYPFMAILFGYFAGVVYSLVRNRGFALSVVVLSALLLPSLYSATITTISFVNNDTRLDFYKWSQNYFTGTETIGYDSDNLQLIVSKVSNNVKGINLPQPGDTFRYFISGRNQNPGPSYVKVLEISDELKVGPPISVFRLL